jgi:type II secretion system protein I
MKTINFRLGQCAVEPLPQPRPLGDSAIRRSPAGAASSAFTLLEVMIAVVIFTAATISILGLVAQAIDNARRLQQPAVDAGQVAAQLSLTNKLVEGTYWGDLSDLLGDDYRGYTWTENVVEVQSNKLFAVDITLERQGQSQPVSHLQVLLFRPDSPPGSLDGGPGIRGR